MALDYRTENMLAEIRAGEKTRDDRMGKHKDRVKSYAGPGYWKDLAGGNPDNHDFEWVALVSPQIVFQNPRFLTRTEKPEHSMWAIASRYHMNRLVHEINAKKEWERLAIDMGFLWGVSHVTPRPIPGAQHDEHKRRPQLKRLPQDRFAADAPAQDWEEARWLAKLVVMDKERALKRAKSEPGWNVKAMEALVEGKVERISRPTIDFPSRSEVWWWEVWCPELDEHNDKHHNGSIMCYADSGIPKDMGGDKPLRDAEPFFGPPSGPFTLYGAYFVPDQLWPLSPLGATDEQVADLNRHARALSKAGERRKRILVFDSLMADEQAKNEILMCPDGGAATLAGLDRQNFIEAELGGVTETGLAYYQLARERLDRVSGIHEVARGNVSSGDTATAVAVAARAQADRLGFLAEKFYESAERDAEKMLWYSLLGNRVVESLPEEFLDELRERGMPIPPGATAAFEGGDFNGDPADLEIRIEPMSMRRRDEGLEQARTMQAFQTALAAAPMLPQISLYTDIDGLFADLGEGLNMPRLGERFDSTKARMIGAAMLGAQMQQDEPPKGKSQSPPRFSSDVGARAAKPMAAGQTKANPGSLPGYSAGRKASAGSKRAAVA